MLIKFHCPVCDAKLSAETNEASEGTDCPACGAPIQVPTVTVGPGVVVDGFQIEKCIGHGGMGDVFLATQLSMNRQVAFKVLSPTFASNPELVGRFNNEMRILANLNHPNIVTALKAGNDQGVHYLAMLYVDGEATDALVDMRGPFSEQEALRVAGEIAQALSYAWENVGVMHRDIKPGNIMIDRDNHVWLMDLGIAKSIEATHTFTLPGRTLGSPHYMSPEQATSAADVDFRTDIYSLGATLFHLVTGAPPYNGASINEIIAHQLHSPLPSVCERNPSLSRSFERLMEVLMAKDLEERPRTWQQALVDIRQVKKGLVPVTPRPKSTKAKRLAAVTDTASELLKKTIIGDGSIRAQRKRTKALWGSLAATLAIGALGFGVFISRNRPTPPTPPTPSPAPAEQTTIIGAAPSPTLPETSIQAASPKTPETPTPTTSAQAEPPPQDLLGRIRKAIAAVSAALPAGTELKSKWQVTDDGVELDLSGNADFSDLTPLATLPLTQLAVRNTAVYSLDPLAGMPLRGLDATGTTISNLDPLVGAPITSLRLANTPIADLAFVRFFPLQELTLHSCSNVKDVAPLGQCRKLERLTVPEGAEGISLLREIPGLTHLNTEWDSWTTTASAFWASRAAPPTPAPVPTITPTTDLQVDPSTEPDVPVEEAPPEEEAPQEEQDSIEPDLQAAARELQTELCNRLARDLLSGKPSRAWKRLKKARQDRAMLPVSRQIEDLVLWLAGTLRAREQIRSSFRADIGRDLQVGFAKGRKQMRIRDVGEDGIRALAFVRTKGGHGYVGRTFRVDELSVAERRKRLLRSKASHSAIALGLLALKADDRTAAARYFATGGDLGRALAAVATPKVAPQDVPKQQNDLQD
ncbi:MAG: protein kinase [Lentisphaerae bacterium]|jgi:serine/threonine protein kinase|nr:protein kinase [Lentisphaerota bacterium]MBT4819482.1 protein kinase [Lentisphaerota bacterium]MBT5610759.1 protein kinase [Lentisphaerota bacterium]MBT7060841.1 protein kinase [Lentisphaerota bacterium]MBT7841270.1 protein kinase [Lentisphaerota bacterium]